MFIFGRSEDRWKPRTVKIAQKIAKQHGCEYVEIHRLGEYRHWFQAQESGSVAKDTAKARAVMRAFRKEAFNDEDSD